MELRHLRYFVAVAEALNFTKAAAQLRVAQPALGRQVQDLEEEIGVDLFKRSPRGVTLTAEGKLFLEEARDILKRAGESVEKVRALARGEYGELHIGYAPTPSMELLPPAMVAFQKVAPRVKVILHDLAGDELVAGLLNGSLELAIMVEDTEQAAGRLEFERLRSYPFCLAMATGHPFTRKKKVSLEEVASQPLVALRRYDYAEFYRILERLFKPLDLTTQIAVECDSASSMLTAMETGGGVGIVSELFRHVAGKRLVFRPLSNATVTHNVGVARAVKGDVTPAGEEFCKILRKVAARQP